MNTRSSPPHILAVDDEPINLALFKAFFFGLPYTVTLCPSGERAIEMLLNETHEVDAVVLDMMMPGLDGLDVLHALRADERTRGLPVIAQSGNGDAENIRKALDAGASDYLVKPFVLNDLMASLQRVAPGSF